MDPLRDLETVARWALLNLLVGNNDAHAKNLSLLYSPEGVRLAPIYDVVSTEVYPQIDRHFALELGGQKTPEGLHPAALNKFARSLGMRGPAVAGFGFDLMDRVRGELDAVLHGVAAEHGHDPVLDQIHELVVRRMELLTEWLQPAARRDPR
ncbi:MAG TPA: HipA domain-containing protein [Longimicrobium sp.]|nr:HipA domain-containing protein [Longimicrobium sp.]